MKKILLLSLILLAACGIFKKQPEPPRPKLEPVQVAKISAFDTLEIKRFEGLPDYYFRRVSIDSLEVVRIDPAPAQVPINVSTGKKSKGNVNVFYDSPGASTQDAPKKDKSKTDNSIKIDKSQHEEQPGLSSRTLIWIVAMLIIAGLLLYKLRKL